ncbi:MAG: FHA domain-containing protein, partial [Chloroflexi bacterium]|nr:FHA domain-containing protein [Chloroflexota bacterium]
MIDLVVSLAAIWGFMILWAATVGYIFWDSGRRKLADQQRFGWLLAGLIPFVGFLAYLALGRPGGRSRRHGTRLKRPQGAANLDPPTIAAVAWQGAGPGQQPLTQGFTLAATAGPYAGQRFTVDTLPAQLGRVADCLVRLAQDSAVSRQHAEFYEQAGLVRLRDLNSSHGTTLNGSPIQDEVVGLGDHIQVGNSVLV